MRSCHELVDRFLYVDSVYNEGEACKRWPQILSCCYDESFHNLSLTRMLAKLIFRGIMNQENPGACQDFIEVFAGQANLTRELLRSGKSGSAFDITFEAHDHNVETSSGLKLILDALTCVCRDGLAWVACECSSFTVMCRHQSQRTHANNFQGDCTRSFVTTGNMLQTISSLILFLAYALHLKLVLEQPQSSCLPQCVPMRGVLNFIGAQRYGCYLGIFGAESLKPLALFSNWPRLAELDPERPTFEHSLVKRHGDQFTGKKDAMKASQTYTPAFAMRIAELFNRE